MPAINQPIPNLIGGVSQQPDSIKMPGQIREAKNVLLDPTFGCRKRPPVQFTKRLGVNIPDNAKWFSIFRDNNEKYIVAIYESSGSPILRVWEATTGTERTVNTYDSAATYLKAVDYRNDIQPLTINDYTIIANRNIRTALDTNSAPVANNDALVVVDEVSYNTVYAIDFIRDGSDSAQTKVYKAAKLSLTPSTWELDDDGVCALAGTDQFTVDSGSKIGLQFAITTNCDPFMTHGQIEGVYYPTGIEAQQPVDADGLGEYFFGGAQNFAEGSYLYKDFTVSTPMGEMQIRAEFRVAKVGNPDPEAAPKYTYNYVTSGILSYTTTDVPWAVGQSLGASWVGGPFTTDVGKYYPAGSTFRLNYLVKTVLQGPDTPTYDYKSRYTAAVKLLNGGSGWRVGDTATATLNGQTYTVKVEEETYQYSYEAETTVSYTTGATGTLDVGTIVAGLVSAIEGLTPYSAKAIGNVIYIQRTDGRSFNIATRGGAGNGAMRAIKDSISDVSKLPPQAEPGFTVAVLNSGSTAIDDYYLKFTPQAGDIPGAGSWEETVKPGVSTDLNPNTMPYALIRESNGDFTLRALTRSYNDKLYWKDRKVGDQNTNRDPSFVGKTINSLFFYRNRLGILSDAAVILSQPGDYFNFWRKSAMVSSDADPIDMAPSATKPAVFKWALGTPAGLMLFADSSQYLMSSREVAFSPATAEMSEISNFFYNSTAPPVETGVSLIFVTEDETYSKVYEYLASDLSSRPLSAELTRIVPEYLPAGIKIVASSANSGITLFGDGSNKLWVFKFFNQASQRLMAGWAHWELPCPILMVAYNQDTAYIVANNNGDVILSTIETMDDPDISPILAFGRLFTPRLDHFIRGDSITPIDNSDGTVTLNFPAGSYVEGSSASLLYTMGSDSNHFISPEVNEAGGVYSVTVDADVIEHPFVLGLNYNLSVELPAFFYRTENNADTVNNVMVKFLYLDLFMTGLYSAKVIKPGYEDIVIDLDLPHAGITLASEPSIKEAVTVPVPIFCQGNVVKVLVESSNPMPSSIIGYSWTGHYSTRGVQR